MRDNLFGFDYFTVTDEHIKLMREMNVGWQDVEFGAPEIDPKRPYGNSDVLEDMAGIVLGIMPVKDDDGYLTSPELTDDQENYLRGLHKQTETALQIFLATGTMRAGNYRAEKYSNRWEPVPSE